MVLHFSASLSSDLLRFLRTRWFRPLLELPVCASSKCLGAFLSRGYWDMQRGCLPFNIRHGMQVDDGGINECMASQAAHLLLRGGVLMGACFLPQDLMSCFPLQSSAGPPSRSDPGTVTTENLSQHQAMYPCDGRVRHSCMHSSHPAVLC